ncbi:TIGR03032 family protein [Aliiroseovarius subalbicans]|uniref:TIGR03032 family protein n=1 Tax=Aliiroseovarius subalbicans TaxID=2925840 RepID=UPI001F59820C|nr:TIGR03032 family protein [Aliiroseovarius subalbicans]MCI2399940.1 TIGR03032 family protein [Aliiroseovarius subalbicans]
MAQCGREEPPGEETTFSVSANLAGRLAGLNASLAVTSYQSGFLYLVGRNAQDGVNIHQAAMPKPMGLCLDDDGGLTMTAGYQILRFQNILDPGQMVNGAFDTCFVPRVTHVTGALDAHDIGIDDQGRAVFVNTRFNCLAVPSARHSFEEIWRPPFISALVDEDRCHLNGLAMENGRPRYVTAVSRSDTIDGWRDRRADGGIVVDVETGKVVCEGLSMPHSPRMHDGQLWLLNSGTGELGFVAFDTPGGMGRFKPKVFCPGFLRGLSFAGNLAFVGLSRPRYQRFEGLALDQRLRDADSDAWCGVQVIDLSKGSCTDWLRVDGGVGELFDVAVIPGSVCPIAVPPVSEEAANLITYGGMIATPPPT